MKKLLGFFSALGLTSSLSSAPTSGFARNDFDWTTPTTVLASISKLLNNRVFSNKEEFNRFIESEIFNRYTHIIPADSNTFKPKDILVSFKEIEEGKYNFSAAMCLEDNGKISIFENTRVNLDINILIK